MAEAQTKRTKKSKGCVCVCVCGCVCVCDFRVRNGTLKLGAKGSFYSQFFVSTYFHSPFVIWLRKLTGGYLFQTPHLFIILIIYLIEILIKSDFACLYGKKFNVKKRRSFTNLYILPYSPHRWISCSGIFSRICNNLYGNNFNVKKNGALLPICISYLIRYTVGKAVAGYFQEFAITYGKKFNVKKKNGALLLICISFLIRHTVG